MFAFKQVICDSKGKPKCRETGRNSHLITIILFTFFILASIAVVTRYFCQYLDNFYNMVSIVSGRVSSKLVLSVTYQIKFFLYHIKLFF
jgi:hypothetical protein